LELNVWHKSDRSQINGQCVEVKDTGTSVLVRDRNSPTGPVLVFTYDEWRAFVGGAQDGDFDPT
jgi:hypothetical protein